MDPLKELRAAIQAVDAYYKERGIFQGRFGFGQSPALIVIDMAYGWTDPAYAAGSPRLHPALPATQRLLPVPPANVIPVNYTSAPAHARPRPNSTPSCH